MTGKSSLARAYVEWMQARKEAAERPRHARDYGATPVSKHYRHVRTALMVVCAPESDYVWRVDLSDMRNIEFKYIGYNPIDSKRVTIYHTFEALPEWVQGRIAVLRMMPPDPTESAVFNVGRRVSETVYWVVK